PASGYEMSKARDDPVTPPNAAKTRAFARFSKNLLDDVVMLLRPVNPAPQLPDVDQIAHDIECLELVLAQKIEQRACVRATRAQMNIGNPRRADATDGIWSPPPKRSLDRKSRCAQDRHRAFKKISALARPLFGEKPAEALSRQASANLTALCLIS